jgi:hypothetical protein
VGSGAGVGSAKIKAIIVITETARRVSQKKLDGIEPRRNFLVVAESMFKVVVSA